MKTKQYLVAHPLISTLYHTNNGGRTWTQYQDTLWKRPGQSPFGIRFLSSQVGIVWSGKDFWKTLNGGITWVGYESPRAITFQTVDFVQSHEGWALINNGSTIWSTHDGGATWNVVGP
jgi:photosystem II stability/assembly factor-like uncharacterized protein